MSSLEVDQQKKQVKEASGTSSQNSSKRKRSHSRKNSSQLQVSIEEYRTFRGSCQTPKEARSFFQCIEGDDDSHSSKQSQVKGLDSLGKESPRTNRFTDRADTHKTDGGFDANRMKPKSSSPVHGKVGSFTTQFFNESQQEF